MKNLVRSLALVVSATCANNVNAEAQSFLSFDFTNGQIENGFGDWMYSDKGENQCAVYNGENQSKLCHKDGYRLYPYYNGRNSDHMGWLQFGYIDSSTEFTVSGSSLRMHLTGGYYKGPNDTPTIDGSVIKSKADFTGPEDLGSQSVLPGDISLYYKGPSSYSKIPELAGKNRLTLWVLMPKGSVNKEEYSLKYQTAPTNTFSYYPFMNSSKGAHYYHRVSNIPMGGWTKIQFDASPTHKNSGAPNELHAFREGGTEYAGNGAGYFSNTAAFALRADFSKRLPANSVYYIDEIETDFVPYENEETIKSLSVGFDPETKDFDISLEDKYRCTTCNATYEVRYAFAPIDNSNFESAYLPKFVTNFDRSMSNNEGLLHKPKNGYNLVWGQIEPQDVHKHLIAPGQTVYFAVKDISVRKEQNQYPEDSEQVDVPNVGLIAKNRLVKTISYPVIDVVYPLELKTTEIDKPIVGYEFEQQVEVDGGQAPYNLTAHNLPVGIELQGNKLMGVPRTEGATVATVTVEDAGGALIEQKLLVDVLTEDALKVRQCQVVADFDDETGGLTIGYFDTVINDVYTGLYKTGMTTVVGSNKQYNYQGVAGAGIDLYPGDQIRLIWRNIDSKPINFYPKLSFDVQGRLTSQNADLWHELNGTQVESDEVGVTTYTVQDVVAAGSINVNSNFSNNKTLLLEQIEIVSSQFADDEFCKQPIKYKKVAHPITFDFQNGVEQESVTTEAFDTVFMDVYTNYYEEGVAITIGDNKNYNYQGIKGAGTSISTDSVVRVVWKNYGTVAKTFTPSISFDYEGRIIYGGNWYQMSEVSIDAFDFDNQQPSEAVAYFTIGSETDLSYIDLININAGLSNNKQLVLDRIEIHK